MLEICDYILENYPGLKNKVARWQLLSLLDKNEDKIIIVKEDNKFKGAAMYAKLTDETLWQLEYGFLNISNPDTINRMLQETGNNIHFLCLIADGVKTILKGLREVIKKENPQTVSWYNPEMTKFNKFKREVQLCHQ